MNLWLSPEILLWNIDLLNSKTSADFKFLKPYRDLKHAKKILNEIGDEEDTGRESLALGDVVIHLRSAIELREKQLITKFNLASLSLGEASKKQNNRNYEKLIQLGVIQPIFLQKLINLRNTIIHEQKYPLLINKSEINELYEFAWYFVRSTDSFLGRSIDGTVYYPPDFINKNKWDDEDDYDGCFLIEITMKPQWQILVRGENLLASLFSGNEKQDWLELAVNNFNDSDSLNKFSAQDYINAFNGKEILSDGGNASSDRDERIKKSLELNDRIKEFSGTVVGPVKYKDRLIEKYFELYMYY